MWKISTLINVGSRVIRSTCMSFCVYSLQMARITVFCHCKNENVDKKTESIIFVRKHDSRQISNKFAFLLQVKHLHC